MTTNDAVMGLEEIKKCPQCGYDSADTRFDWETKAVHNGCPRCGYREDWEWEDRSDGTVCFKFRAIESAGVLLYHWKGELDDYVYYLPTKKEVLKSAEWLRERLASGQVDRDSAYVSGWNPDTESVEFEVGRFEDEGSHYGTNRQIFLPTSRTPT